MLNGQSIRLPNLDDRMRGGAIAPITSPPSSLFTTSRPVRSFDDVVNQVQDAIRSGKLHTGDRLASERELCSVFGVSRATLREALRQLEALGSVEIRTGSTGGVFVADPSSRQAADAVEVLVRFHQVSAGDLHEFRESFERETAQWAALRATEDDIRMMRLLVQELEGAATATDGSWATISELDLRFHNAVAEASKNRLRIAIMRAVFTSVQRASLALEAWLDRPARAGIAVELRAILSAIEAHDPETAGRRMAEHVAKFSQIESEVERSEAFDAARTGRGGRAPP